MPRIALSFAVTVLVLSAPAAVTHAQSSPQEQVDQVDQVDRVARDVIRLESLRAVKDLQRSYAQYAQFGLWMDMADLFATHGRLIWGEESIEGREAIAAWLEGHGGPVSDPGALNTELIDDPLVNLSVDGLSAEGRWRGL